MNKIALDIISKQIHLCKKCPILRQVTPNSMPYWCKSENPKIFVVALNPGLEYVEDEYSQPVEDQEVFYNRYLNTFLEDSKLGQFLTKLFFNKEFVEKYIFFTNLIKCRKPRNIDFKDQFFINCKPYLLDQILAVDPKVVIIFSKKFRKYYKVEEINKPTLVLNHPSYYNYDINSIEYWNDSEEVEEFLLKYRVHKENISEYIKLEPAKELADGTYF